MVDKVWFDWQNKDPASFWSYKGGSVENLTSLQALKDYPNGMPPELLVSAPSHLLRCTTTKFKHLNTDIIQLDSIIPADGMFPEVTIRDVMNTTGGHLCYVYE